MATKDLKHDDVTRLLATQIDNGIAQINKVNDVLLADETGTPLREIDKALKEVLGDDSDAPENIKVAAKASAEAYEAYRAAVDNARNLYRTEVLQEEAKVSSVSDEDKENAKEVRKLVMDAISFLKTYATGNNKTDIVAWADSLAIPQVGRQGTSTVGAKKPRVYVKVNETVYDSFSQAALALSSKDNKITAGNLAEAWHAAGGNEGDFTFGDLTITVTNKPKKSDG